MEKMTKWIQSEYAAFEVMCVWRNNDKQLAKCVDIGTVLETNTRAVLSSLELEWARSNSKGKQFFKQ